MERVRERLAQQGAARAVQGSGRSRPRQHRLLRQRSRRAVQEVRHARCGPHLATLKTQFAAYEKAVRADVMPRTRTDFKLPPELYASNLEQFGVDIPPAELAQMAHTRLRRDPEGDAGDRRGDRARSRADPSADYRDVIRELKKQQLVGDAILPHYQARLKRARGDHPPREARHAADASRADPHRQRRRERADSPRRTCVRRAWSATRGEQGEFVLPLNIPSADPAKAKQYDDFTFEAASWTLTAHEARPGHELQFAAMVEHGVSQARAHLRVQQHQRRGLGPLRRVHRQAVHAARRPADLAAAPAAARRARVHRSRAADRARPRRSRSSSC